MAAFRFINGPWENSELPAIVMEDPEGGDPRILATIKRVHNPDAIYQLCRDANAFSARLRAALKTDGFRKRVMFAIFDPGASEGFKGTRDLTTWQTDAVMQVLSAALTSAD